MSKRVDATGFYHSQAWKHCREEYAKSRHYLCERCMMQGRYTPGVIVHHIEELSPLNIENPEKTTGFSNLMLLCRQCHADVHKATNTYHRKPKRYIVDANGKVSAKV